MAKPLASAPRPNWASAHQRLVAWSPISHLRLLLWLLWFPGRLRDYDQLHSPKWRESSTTQWFAATLVCLPFFLLHAAADAGTIPHNIYNWTAWLIPMLLWVMIVVMKTWLKNDSAGAVAGIVAGVLEENIDRGESNFLSRAALIALPVAYAALIWLLFLGGWQMLGGK